MARKDYILSDQFIEDIHTTTAQRIFGRTDPDARLRAKTINYAEAYGAGDISIGKISGQFPNPPSPWLTKGA